MASSRKRQTVTAVAVVAALGLLGLGAVPAQQGASGTRTFDMPTVAPGGTLVVTIAATGYGIAGGVTETLPAGFTYVSSSLDDSQIRRYSRADGWSGSYCVGPRLPSRTRSGPPVTVGSHTFTGTLRDDDPDRSPDRRSVGGDGRGCHAHTDADAHADAYSGA